MQIDLQQYSNFVQAITSPTSEDLDKMIARLNELRSTPHLNISLALTSAAGMCGESGEFSEIFKKVLYHGKPFDDATRAHATKELGDAIWYWANACRSIDVDPNEVIANNVSKLESRYPGGTFSAASSATRAAGDI